MTAAANVSRFLFQIPSLDESLRVVGFQLWADLSTPFRCEVELACENPALDLPALVGKSGVLTLFHPQHPQYLQGEIQRIQQGESGNRFTLYQLTLVPRLEFLKYRSNLRIFQQQSVPDIVRQVLKEAGIEGEQVCFDLQDSYPRRDYCTQYRETDFHFISRLLEEEGLFYFFEHRPHAHTMVITDHNNRCQPIAGEPSVRFKEGTGMPASEESIYQLHSHASIQPGTVTLRDYSLDKTRLRLEQTDSKGNFGELEHYRYRGNFTDPAVGARYSLRQRQAQQVAAEQLQGESDCARLAVGQRFRVHDHPLQALNAEYILQQVHMQGRQPQSLEAGSSSAGSQFSVAFRALPARVPYRPLPLTAAPRIHGTQTAFVTGPAGEEIYTDPLGRIKVQFHWDREGRYNENSSCWLRVSQALAGNQWGALVLPRIGQEVIVAFLEGNPDRPLVTGTVYNGANLPPYSLPAHKTRSTFKSYSSPGGGGFNELHLDDKAGQERIYLRAQKDLDLYVRNDWKEWIGHDHHTRVAGNLNRAVAGEQNRSVRQQHNLQVSGNQSHQIGQSAQLKINGSHVEQAGQDIVLKAGMTLVIEAGVELTLKAGAGLVKLDPSGVTIKGPMVRINSGGAATPGKPAVVTAPQTPMAADQGDRAGKASAPALPNTAPKVGKSKSVQWLQGGRANPDQPVQRVAVAGQDTSLSIDELAAADSWVSITLETPSGDPVANAQYLIVDKDGKEYRGVTDGQGVARIQGLPAGDCEVSFPDSGPWKK